MRCNICTYSTIYDLKEGMKEGMKEPVSSDSDLKSFLQFVFNVPKEIKT